MFTSIMTRSRHGSCMSEVTMIQSLPVIWHQRLFLVYKTKITDEKLSMTNTLKILKITMLCIKTAHVCEQSKTCDASPNICVSAVSLTICQAATCLKQYKCINLSQTLVSCQPCTRTVWLNKHNRTVILVSLALLTWLVKKKKKKIMKLRQFSSYSFVHHLEMQQNLTLDQLKLQCT